MLCNGVHEPRSEAGSWWYANARLQITVLTICVWTKESGRLYLTYATNILDQSTPLALTCVRDAISRCEGADACSAQRVWADSGGHFRSTRFLGETLVTSLSTRPVLQQTDVHFFAEGHGMGPIDAHFGRMAQCPWHV